MLPAPVPAGGHPPAPRPARGTPLSRTTFGKRRFRRPDLGECCNRPGWVGRPVPPMLDGEWRGSLSVCPRRETVHEDSPSARVANGRIFLRRCALLLEQLFQPPPPTPSPRSRPRRAPWRPRSTPPAGRRRPCPSSTTRPGSTPRPPTAGSPTPPTRKRRPKRHAGRARGVLKPTRWTPTSTAAAWPSWPAGRAARRILADGGILRGEYVKSLAGSQADALDQFRLSADQAQEAKAAYQAARTQAAAVGGHGRLRPQRHRGGPAPAPGAPWPR